MSNKYPINKSQTRWNQVSLEDYENHMKHDTVGQLQMLSSLTRKYLNQYKPGNLLLLGIAGGNGLEHINPRITHQVVGIDINEDYLQQTQHRFKDRLPDLKLIQCNVDETLESFIRADLIWAALFLEYVDLKNCVQFMLNNLSKQGVIIVTIQSNNGVGAVSESGIEGVKVLSGQFKRIDKDILMKGIAPFDLNIVDEEENVLPNGKSFLTYTLQLGGLVKL